MHEIHGGLGFRHNDDLGRKFSSVGHCSVFVLDGPTVAQQGRVYLISDLSVSSETFSLFYHSNNWIVILDK